MQLGFAAFLSNKKFQPKTNPPGAMPKTDLRKIRPSRLVRRSGRKKGQKIRLQKQQKSRILYPSLSP